MFTASQGRRLARTQDEGAVGFCVEDEDAANGVPGRRERGERCRSGHEDADLVAERMPGSTRERELDRVHDAADGCRDCPLYEHATQMVFGEGPAPAELMLLGEQPGDKEDRAGHPFVGPAGALLDEVLVDAGIDRSVVYVTNAVKHFKWDHTRGGKVRIHKSPSRSEVVACSQWWQQELAAVTPKVLVCLGAIATKAVLGPAAKVTELRGQVVEQLAVAVVPTYHPAAVLRAAERKDQMRDDLVRDLHVAAGLLDG